MSCVCVGGDGCPTAGPQVRRRAARGSRAPADVVAPSPASSPAARRSSIVHGGGKEIDAALKAAGIEKRQVDGLRITDEATLDVVVSVLAGAVNTRLVAALNTAGVAAVGLTGADAACGLSAAAPPHRAVDGRVVDLGRVGVPERGADMRLLQTLTARAVRAGRRLHRPRARRPAVQRERRHVRGTPGGAAAARGGWSSPARRRACSTPAARRCRCSTPDAVARLVSDGTATAGMIAKLRACEHALAHGVDDVVIVDGRDRAGADGGGCERRAAHRRRAIGRRDGRCRPSRLPIESVMRTTMTDGDGRRVGARNAPRAADLPAQPGDAGPRRRRAPVRRGRPRVPRPAVRHRRRGARPRASGAGARDRRSGADADSHVEPVLSTRCRASWRSGSPTLSGLPRAFFCNSGTEAVEACLKFARRYWYTKGEPRREFIALDESFHGRTFGALSVTSDEHYRAPFEPLLPAVKFVPTNDPAALAAAVSTLDGGDHRRAGPGRRRRPAADAGVRGGDHRGVREDRRAVHRRRSAERPRPHRPRRSTSRRSA